MYMAVSTTAGSFRGVVPGAAWWFADHRRGMLEQLRTMAETGHIGAFTGMLTDSRSFLSYARHDYFRRVLCSFIAEEIDNGTFMSEDAAVKLLNRLCVLNARKLFA
jgi:glucuronate isomerase